MSKLRCRRSLMITPILVLLPFSVALSAPADYPTAAIADYVYGCMKANGETQPVLRKCSCSLDVVASLVPYDDYSAAEAYLGLRRMTGERASLFRDSEASTAVVDRLRRAQAEADVRCF